MSPDEVLLSARPLAKLAAEASDLASRTVAAALLGELELAEELALSARVEQAPMGAEANGWVLLAKGHPARAEVALSDASSPLGHALAAEALLALSRPREAERRLDAAGSHPMAILVRASTTPWDRNALAEAPTTGVLGARAHRQRAAALLRGTPPDPSAARAEVSFAVWHLLRLGAPGELGRCYVAMAEIEAASAEAHDGQRRQRAAAWLARAHPLLHRAGNEFELEALRRSFRRFGRRAIDRLVDEDLEGHIEGVRRGRARVVDLLSASVDQRGEGADSSALDAQVLATLENVEESQERLIGTLEQLVVDRERLGQLVGVCRKVFLLETEAELDATAPELALELGGTSATLFDSSSGEPVEVHVSGAPPANPDRVAAVARETHETRTPQSVEDDEGTTSAIPLGQKRPMVLAVRRVTSKRRMGADHLERLEIFGSVLEAAYVRAAHAAAVRESAARDAATLEAIHEGVVTLDGQGRVRTTNAAARSLLDIATKQSTGRLRDIRGLRPLAEAIERGAEDEAVSLPRVEVLVRSKRYAGGAVATLRELRSAQRLAHKLVGGGARFTFDDLAGRDPRFLDALADAQRVAATNTPVLITGESGTGKELLAQAIHNDSSRADQPFVGVNVAAVPRELLESELFGYERGAFTGARARGHAGRFELADRGTLLLDEIGDMPMDMQAKMLRVLQERVVQRLGGTREIPVRARVIATTHRDLEQSVAEGTFRLDLFYRLRVVHLKLPSLHDRMDDVRLLVELLLDRCARRAHRSPIQVAPEVMEALERYHWPGNVRELANLMESVVALLPPETTVWRTIPRAVQRAMAGGGESSDTSAREGPPLPESIRTLADTEKRAVEMALEASEGNITYAAELLAVSRQTLYNKMKRHGLR